MNESTGECIEKFCKRPRVAIARTILESPPIALLDEAASALDSRTGKEIRAALESISRKSGPGFPQGNATK